jgi:hypothetical protein
MPWRIRGILRKYCGTEYGRPERGRPVSARLDELERLEKAWRSELPLSPTRAERIRALMAGLFDDAPALLAVARAAEELIRDMDGPEADWSTHAVRVALAALDSTPGGGR